jgi:hypothetical protein
MKEQLVSDEVVLPYLLGDDCEAAKGWACWWAYGNNAGNAYGAFLNHGRGFLWGPVAADSEGYEMDHDAWTAAVSAGEPFELLMVYSRPEDYPLSTLPADLTKKVCESVGDYDPKREINLLFKAAGGRRGWGFFCGRFGRGGFMDATPVGFYEARELSPAEFRSTIKQKRQRELPQ